METILTTQSRTTPKQYIKKKKKAGTRSEKMHTIFRENSWAPESGFPKLQNDYLRRWLEGGKRVGWVGDARKPKRCRFQTSMQNTLFTLQLQRHCVLFRWSTRRKRCRFSLLQLRFRLSWTTWSPQLLSENIWAITLRESDKGISNPLKRRRFGSMKEVSLVHWSSKRSTIFIYCYNKCNLTSSIILLRYSKTCF